MFTSQYEVVDKIQMPAFTGLRVMHMPFDTRDADSLRGIADQYIPLVSRLAASVPAGIGYLTIDEAELRAGEHHRRPGLHVDGVDETGGLGAWGGDNPGKGGWGANGMLIVSTHIGCRTWRQNLAGSPNPNGDCSHLREQCGEGHDMLPNHVYLFDGMTLHESLPVAEDCRRQFLRLSAPSNAAWYDGYTKNPNGVLPTGEIRTRRAFMDYRG